MNNDYLMNSASILFIIYYITEMYNNDNKNNILYQKIILVSGNTIALIYSVEINNNIFIFNYSSLFTLNIIWIIIYVYYFYKNKNINITNITNIRHNIENQMNPIHNSINQSYSEYSICYV
jgi:hypothetical protein